jgi:hypothetical protein
VRIRITARAAGNSQPVPELQLQSRPLFSLAHPLNAFPGSSAARSRKKMSGRFSWNAGISTKATDSLTTFRAKGFFYTPRMN